MNDKGLRKELSCLAVLLFGIYENTPWKQQGKSYDFYDLKGTVESLAAQFKLPMVLRPMDHFLLVQNRGIECVVKDTRIGFFGELSSGVLDRYGLSGSVHVMELDFDALVGKLPHKFNFVPVPKFPETYRDLSVLVDKSTLSGTLEDLVRSAGEPLLHKVELYDCFEDKKLPSGKKSLTFALSFQSPDKTLTDDEVNPVFEQIVRTLSEHLGATLRDA